MSLAATISYTTPLAANPISRDDIDATLDSATVALTGTVGASDLDARAVNSTHTVPGPHFYGDGLKFGSAGSEYYIVTLPTKPTAHAAGLRLYFKADSTNTGDTVKLRIAASPSGNLSDTLIKTQDGQDILAGQIRANSINCCVYDGTYYRLISTVPRPTRIVAGTAGGTANAVTLTITHPNTSALSDVQNVEIEFIAAATNTGATTLQLNFSSSGSLAATAIRKNGTVALSGYEMAAGQICRVVYDGTYFQLVSVRANDGARHRDDAHRLVVAGSANTVTVEAEQLVVKAVTDTLLTSGQKDVEDTVVLRNVSVSIDISASAGANAIDTGSAANADYYVWILYKPSDGSVCGVLSRNYARVASNYELHPTMPSGYTHAACVGACRRVAGSIISFRQRGKRVVCAYQNFLLTGGGAWTSQDLTSALPTYGIKSVSGFVGSTAGTTFRMSLAAYYDGSNYLGIQQAGGVTHGSTNFGVAANYCSIPFNDIAVTYANGVSSCAVYYNVENGTCYLNITGYELE